MDDSGIEGSWEEIGGLIARLRAIKDDVCIVVVANVKTEPMKYGDYANNSVITEYYSITEIESIITGFHNCGFFVIPFHDEAKFIKWVLNAQLNEIPKRYKIVCASAQSGTGPGRKSLIPAFCELQKIAITGSDAYVVGLARQKFHVNRILESLGIPTPPTWYYSYSFGWLGNRSPPAGDLVIAKLTFESASIGIGNDSVIVVDRNTEERIDALSRTYNQPITIQQFIEGFEVEVPIIQLIRPFSPMVVGISLDGKRHLDRQILTYDLVSDLSKIKLRKVVSSDCRSQESPTNRSGVCRLKVQTFSLKS